jgi:signal transduction histidine kinase
LKLIERIKATRFWSRLGQANTIGLAIFIVSLSFSATLSLAFDVVRLQNYSIAWIGINAISIAWVLVVGVPIMLLKRKRNPHGKPQPIFNIAFMGLAFAFKNTLMISVASVFGITDDGSPFVRFVGGIFLGWGVLIIFTNIVGARIQRETALAKLRDTEYQLKSFREEAFAELEDESKMAVSRTINALSPQLETLNQSAKLSQDNLQVIETMQAFIQNELKPFGSSLPTELRIFSSTSNIPKNQRTNDPDVRISPSGLIRVWITMLPLPFLYYLVTSFAIPTAKPDYMFIALLVFMGALTTLKYLARGLPNLKVGQAFFATTAISLVASMPSYFLVSQIPNPAGIPDLLPVYLIIPAWSVISSSQAYILDQRQSRVEELLTVNVQELMRENKLYEQKVWLAKHGWYLLLHGLVQPALTAAAMRISDPQGSSPEVKSRVLADLQRALAALSEPLPAAQNLSFNISEIESVWHGLCEVDVQVSDQVVELAENNPILNQVINEVLKEVVSNAVRHGNASKVDINLMLAGSNDVSIVAINDGSEPESNRPESVGSRMLEALCLERNLSWSPASKSTMFKALIPFK